MRPGRWFGPDKILVQGCGELVVAEPGCMLVWQRFSQWFKVICDDFTLIFAFGGTVVFWPVGWVPYE